jgi:hypothetical protein
MMNKEEYERQFFQKFLASLNNHGANKCLSSVILTGSFGRGEPTYQIVDGGFRLKSDVEIGLVYDGKDKRADVDLLISEVSREFKEDLNLMPIIQSRVEHVFNFNYTLRSPKFKTLFTYDLFNGSKAIWGKDFLALKNISLSSVDLYEAKRLVANRIGELTYLTSESNDNVLYLRKQWKGKLLLAIVSAWLLMEGQYVSSYHAQLQKIDNDSEKVMKQFGKNFIPDYHAVFSFLRESGETAEISDEKMRDYVKCINDRFSEMNLKTPKVNSISRKIKYVVRYMKTSRKYGLFGFEDAILHLLITGYIKNDISVAEAADIWHKVLY